MADEDNFFAWLDKIPAIVEKQGEFNKLYLSIDQIKLNEVDLRELLALFYRYGIDMEQLKTFLNFGIMLRMPSLVPGRRSRIASIWQF